jgi:hypothetical protein
MKLIKKIVLISLLAIACWLIAIQFQSYSPPNQEEIAKRINYLQRVVQEPLDAGSEIYHLGGQSHEWMLFSYSFTSFAVTNIAVQDSSFKNQASEIIRSSLQKVLGDEVASSFSVNSSTLNSDSIPEYSVLYLGHLNLMLGCYRLLSDDTSFNELNDKISKSLYHRYKDSKFLMLESYASSIWVPDNSVAMASLKLHSTNTNSNYELMCDQWVKQVKENYIEPKTNVLYSMVNPITGEATEEPRGSMLGWSIMFIYQFDKDFATELYQNYKSNFSNEFGIFRLFKERYNNSRTNMGDIDSGPIFQGYSMPANEFALGNSVLAKDYKTARKLERLINFGTKTTEENNELKYEVRFVDMNISPMAEALVLNSLTIAKWTDSE